MKKLFSPLLCVVMVLSLVACGSKTDDTQTPDEPQDTAPELSGTMKVIATGDVYGPLFDAFTADTGVEVECLSMSSGEVLSKLRAEGGTPSADLWFGGGIDAFMSAKDDGLLEPVTFDAAAELGDEYKDTEGYWYSKGITIVGFLHNNSLMEELGLTAPESWDDLTESQYEGEIVMSNPAVSGTNYAVVNALLQAKGDQGWDYFEALNNNIAYYGKRGSDPKNKVSSGEFAVGISYIDASIEQAAEENDLTIDLTGCPGSPRVWPCSRTLKTSTPPSTSSSGSSAATIISVNSPRSSRRTASRSSSPPSKVLSCPMTLRSS